MRGVSPRLVQLMGALPDQLANPGSQKALAESVMIEFAGTGSLHQREFVPLTHGAKAILSGPHGAEVDAAIRGWLYLAEQTGGADAISNLRGISMSFTLDARDAAQYASHSVLAHALVEGTSIAPPQKQSVTRNFALVQSLTRSGPSGRQLEQWLEFSPSFTNKFIGLLDRQHPTQAERALGDQLAFYADHELHHLVLQHHMLSRSTATAPLTASRAAMEGAANAGAMRPGRVRDMAAALGIPHTSGYQFARVDKATRSQPEFFRQATDWTLEMLSATGHRHANGAVASNPAAGAESFVELMSRGSSMEEGRAAIALQRGEHEAKLWESAQPM